MKTITEIKAQIKNPTRCNIYLDGQYFCALELETVMRNRLRAGVMIDENRLSEMQAESETSRALDRALNFISASQKTQKQIEDYLRSKGYTDQVVSAVIEKMLGYGYIDDEAYAKSYSKFTSAKKGRRLIALELKRKGVKDADISSAVAEIDGEEEAAKAIAEKYMRGKTKDKANIYKCYKHLISKGFDYDTAKSAVDGIDDEDL